MVEQLEEPMTEDYYSNFARRVYFLAESEGWDRNKTMQYFNDRDSFEKFYTNVSPSTPLGKPAICFIAGLR